MTERHPSELVDSLFAQLTAIEEAIAENQQELLRALDDPYSASVLGELRTFGEMLERTAEELVGAIREQVASANARALFVRPPKRPSEGDTQVDIRL